MALLYQPTLSSILGAIFGGGGGNIPNDLPADIMNPDIYGGNKSNQSIGSALSGMGAWMLPPMNGGAQPSPYLPFNGPQGGPMAGAPNNGVPLAGPGAPPVLPTQNVPPAPVPASPQEPPQAPAQQPPQAAATRSPLDNLSIALHNFRNSPGLSGLVDAVRGGMGGVSTSGNLQETGTDLLNNKTFGIYDPVTQTLKPLNESGGTAGGNIPSIREAMNLPPVYGADGRDEKFLSALDPVSRQYVEGILNGDTAPGIGRNLQKFLPIAQRAERGFTQETYAARVNALKDETSGKTSEIKRATRQSALHFGELADKMEALPGHQMPIANWAENWFKTNVLGKSAMGNFEVNAHALADELSKMFKGAGISDAEIRAWESRLTPDMSREQQRGMMRTLLGLYRDSFAELDRKRQEGLGPNLYAKRGSLLTPEVEQSLSKVEKFSQGQNAGAVNPTNYTWTPEAGLQPR